MYRTPQPLEENGLISRVGHIGESTRLDANTARHHHFICTECGFTGGFRPEGLDDVPIPSGAADVGKVESVHAELRGVCRTCQHSRVRV